MGICCMMRGFLLPFDSHPQVCYCLVTKYLQLCGNIACQVSLCVGFSRQEYTGVGCHCLIHLIALYSYNRDPVKLQFPQVYLLL